MTPFARAVPILLAAGLSAGLATGLAGCGSQESASPAAAGPPGTTAAQAGQSNGAGLGGRPGAGGTSSQRGAVAKVPAAARAVQCPSGVDVPPVPDPAGLTGQAIPAGFSPVAVVECVNLAQFGPGHGLGSPERRLVAVTGLRPLMNALRKAAAEPGPTAPILPCVARLESPWFVLVGQHGQVIKPRLPETFCSAAATPVLASLNSLTWISLGVSAAPPVINRGAVRSGIRDVGAASAR